MAHGMIPVGVGVALGVAHDRYMPGPTMQKLAEANRKTTAEYGSILLHFILAGRVRVRSTVYQ